MWILLGCLFLLSGIFYVFREIKIIKLENDLLIISFVRLLYACSCGFFASILCFLYAFSNIKLRLANLVIIEYTSESLQNLFLFWFCSVIGYAFLSLGYKSLGNKRIVLGKKQLVPNGILSDGWILLVAIICCMAGYIAIFIWTSDMGSIASYIKLASAIRGDYANDLGNYHMGWRKIAGILTGATYIMFFLLLKNHGRGLLNWIVFIASLIGAVIYLICNDGRLTTAMFALILLVGFFRYGDRRNNNIKKQFVILALILLFALILLANLDNITYYIRNGKMMPADTVSTEPSGMFISLMNEFSYIYKSAVTAIEHCLSGGKLLFLDDLVYCIREYIPGTSFLGDGIQVSRYNTILCTNNRFNLGGAIPCDMISLSLYDFNFLGPIIVPFLIGFVIRAIENHFSKKKDNPLAQTFYYGMALVFIRSVTYLEVNDIFISLLPYILIYIFSFAVKMLANLFSCR